MSNPQEDELAWFIEALSQRDFEISGVPKHWEDTPEKKAADAKLMKAIRQYAAKARIDERKQVALDNYHGHTFSDVTNYKGKFDKFVENNEKRIKQLKEGME